MTPAVGEAATQPTRVGWMAVAYVAAPCIAVVFVLVAFVANDVPIVWLWRPLRNQHPGRHLDRGGLDKGDGKNCGAALGIHRIHGTCRNVPPRRRDRAGSDGLFGGPLTPCYGIPASRIACWSPQHLRSRPSHPCGHGSRRIRLGLTRGSAHRPRGSTHWPEHSHPPARRIPPSGRSRESRIRQSRISRRPSRSRLRCLFQEPFELRPDPLLAALDALASTCRRDRECPVGLGVRGGSRAGKADDEGTPRPSHLRRARKNWLYHSGAHVRCSERHGGRRGRGVERRDSKQL